MKDDMFSPPTKSVKAIMKSFKAIGKYNAKFLESLEGGLSRSSYFNAQNKKILGQSINESKNGEVTPIESIL
jgi:hypothetical protein